MGDVIHYTTLLEEFQVCFFRSSLEFSVIVFLKRVKFIFSCICYVFFSSNFLHYAYACRKHVFFSSKYLWHISKVNNRIIISSIFILMYVCLSWSNLNGHLSFRDIWVLQLAMFLSLPAWLHSRVTMKIHLNKKNEEKDLIWTCCCCQTNKHSSYSTASEYTELILWKQNSIGYGIIFKLPAKALKYDN